MAWIFLIALYPIKQNSLVVRGSVQTYRVNLGCILSVYVNKDG